MLKKYILVSVLALALIVGVGAIQAHATLTLADLALTSSGALTLTSAAGSTSALYASTTTGSLTFGTGLTTGDLTIGNNLGTGSVYIYGGTSNPNYLFTNVTTGTVNIATGVTTGNINIGGSQDGSGQIFLGGGTSIGNINIGGGVGQILNIGNLGGAKTVNIGIATGASALNLAAGTGNINLTGHLISKGAPTVITQSDGSGATPMASNTDSAGWLSTNATAHTSVIITFAQAYTVAPHCTFSPSNAAAAILQLTSPGVYGTSTTTALTLTHASSTAVADWEYVCVGTE